MIQSHGLNSISEDDAKINISSSRDLNYKGKNNDLSNGRLFAVLYTSGSTGIPKGARIMHKGVINRLKWQWNEFPYQNGDVCAFKVIARIYSYFSFYVNKKFSILYSN